jgi:hypothetical protein
MGAGLPRLVRFFIVRLIRRMARTRGMWSLVWIWVPLISIGGLTVLMVFVSECETGRERSWGLHVPKMP